MAKITLNDSCFAPNKEEQDFKDRVAIACVAQLINSPHQYIVDASEAYRIAEHLWEERCKRYGTE